MSGRLTGGSETPDKLGGLSLGSDVAICIVYPEQEDGVFRGRDVEGITFLAFSLDDAGVITLEVPSGGKIDFRSIMGLPWVILFTDVENETYVSDAFDLLSSYKLGRSEAPVFVPRTKDRDNVAMAVTEFVAQHYAYALQEYNSCLRSMAELRARHEDLQNNFAVVEAYLSSAGAAPCTMSFENPARSQADVGILTRDILTQELPVSSEALSAIQFHISRFATFPPEAILSVKVVLIEENRTLSHSEIKYAALKEGWNTFIVPAAYGGVQRSVRIILERKGAELFPPFSVGAPQPIPAFCLSAGEDSRNVGGASLAMRCWVGLPGLSTASLEEKVRNSPARVSTRSTVVSPAHLVDVRGILSAWQPGFEPVRYLHDVGGIECHPPPGGLTVGVLEAKLGFSDFITTVDCFVRGEDSQPVCFGLAISTNQPPTNVVSTEAELEQMVLGTNWFSGWATVRVGEMANLSVSVSGISPELPFYVVLATKMDEGRSNSCAWATFAKLRFFVGEPERS